MRKLLRTEFQQSCMTRITAKKIWSLRNMAPVREAHLIIKEATSPQPKKCLKLRPRVACKPCSQVKASQLLFDALTSKCATTKTCCVKAIHAVNEPLWHPGKQAQTNNIPADRGRANLLKRNQYSKSAWSTLPLRCVCVCTAIIMFGLFCTIIIIAVTVEPPLPTTSEE